MMKSIKKSVVVFLCASLFSVSALAQNNNQRPSRPDPSESVKTVVERIYNYLNGCTPAALVDGNGKVIKDYSKIDKNTTYQKGDFGINTYEWGVTYSGMLQLSEVLGDKKYADYVYDRLNVIGKAYPHVKKYCDETGYSMRLTPLNTPKWLDDCGAMTAAMIKATLADPARSKEFRALLDNWFVFTMYEEYRMSDGILARHRPVTNSVWLDDMYMGITPIAYRGVLSQRERGDLTQKYYNEAINQVLLFKKYLWVPEKKIYRHGWVESMGIHPDYHWARANGWAVLTMCDVLDAVPQHTQGWTEVRDLLVALLEGLAPYQSPEGTWHQLLDMNDTYLETSASAMFVYGYAHAINKGWIDKTAFQDIAKSGWAAVARQVNEIGQVENTCVGTGLGWTNTFYANRPVNVYAAHGYGPVLLAGAEMLKLYAAEKEARANMRPARGGFGPMVQRQEGKPMVFLAGDSTCKNGSGNGGNKQWGWGSFFQEYMTDGVVVNNLAVGGLSSRTFYTGNWPALRDQIKEGDYVIIQFGHNDMAPLNTGRARGTLNGVGPEYQTVVMEKNGAPVDVYSYGHYVRMMVRQAKMRGGIPIVVSPTPQNRWESNHKVQRFNETFNAWCEQVAKEEGVVYINVNELAGTAY
ncbi:MAG: glycoside hydrolase family 88 protein, partial [Bacteroidales bacterium]|nr:glycoside hydrolase family 88 protein [Bacteroidales bacterium]